MIENGFNNYKHNKSRQVTQAKKKRLLHRSDRPGQKIYYKSPYPRLYYTVENLCNFFYCHGLKSRNLTLGLVNDSIFYCVLLPIVVLYVLPAQALHIRTYFACQEVQKGHFRSFVDYLNLEYFNFIPLGRKLLFDLFVTKFALNPAAINEHFCSFLS